MNLRTNMSWFFFKVINQLWQAFYTKDPKQLKRKRKRELGGEPITSELKRQISDPVDLSESYDSIRRRSTNFPPPPADKTSNGYGPLITSNNHHRLSSLTGKQSSLSTLVEGAVWITSLNVFVYSQILIISVSLTSFFSFLYIKQFFFLYKT